jgi:hypothetical protein
MNEAILTTAPGQEIILVTDGNPSYPVGTHFLNAQEDDDPDQAPQSHRPPKPRCRVSGEEGP